MRLSVKKNYIYNVSYQLFAILVPLITTPYTSRIFGADGIGVYSYTYSIVRYFWLLSALGVATFGARTIGIYQDDKYKRSYYFWNIFLLKIVLSTIMIFLYYMYVLLIADNKIIAMIQGIYLFGVLFDISWFFQGMEDFKKISIRNFIIKILNLIFIFVFINQDKDLWLYIFGLAFFQLIGSLSMWMLIPKYLHGINIKELRPFSMFKPVLFLFIPSVATQIFAVFDKSMIGWFTKSSIENGYYEQAFKIVDMSLIIITTLSTIMIPKISREYRNGNDKVVKNALFSSFKFVFLLAFPMCMGMVSISSIFVPWFFGEAYSGTVGVLCILSLLYIFMGINSVTGAQYLISTNQQNKHVKYLLIGGGINVIFNLILIPVIKSPGAAIASVLGEATISILELRYLSKSNQLRITDVTKSSFKFLISSIAMLGVILVLKVVFEKTFLAMIIMLVVGVITYFAFLIIMREEFVLQEMKKIVMKIKREKNEVIAK